nr:NADPH-Fe(3+) oxidoreductase subunit beta [Chlamydiota bacterium]
MPSFVSEDSKDVGWLKKNIPCRAFCPTNTDIPGYIEAIVSGEYTKSYEINRRDNIFPGILGRVCTKPCEAPCRHGYEGLGEPVSICSLKRAAWDFGRFDVYEKWKKKPSTGKRVAIVGAGPAGLACANELALWGHDVTVLEKEAIPGGMMTLGIPRFRLPKEVTDFDIRSIFDLGITLKTGIALGVDVTVSGLSSEYDAVIIATGTMTPSSLGIPGEEGDGVYLGLNFMMDFNKGMLKKVPEKVVVIGGGFTAVDCVRSSMRLGAKDVTLAYRRTRTEMSIDKHEIEDMELEGIKDMYLVSPVEVIRDDAENLKAIKLIKNELGSPDESGRRRPVPIEGSEFILETDLLIPAIGQRAEEDSIDGAEGWKSSRGYQLEKGNVFFAGDFRIGSTSIIEAVADAKKASERVHLYLGGEKPRPIAVTIEELPGPGTGRERSDDFIELQKMPTLDLKDRFDMEAEVQLGFDKDTAQCEGKRCYLCDHDYQIDLDKCIYCIACIESMPRD